MRYEAKSNGLTSMIQRIMVQSNDSKNYGLKIIIQRVMV